MAAADGRDPKLVVPLQRVVLDADPEETAAAMVREIRADWFTPQLLPDAPCVLFAASAQDTAEELARRAQRCDSLTGTDVRGTLGLRATSAAGW